MLQPVLVSRKQSKKTAFQNHNNKTYMPIIKQTESTFLPVPAGTHVSRCYSMVSIGTQKSLNPQYTPKFQVILFFEIPGETITVGGETRPMVISEWLNCYFGSATKPCVSDKMPTPVISSRRDSSGRVVMGAVQS